MNSVRINRPLRYPNQLSGVQGLTFQAQGVESILQLVETFKPLSSIDLDADTITLKGDQRAAFLKLVDTLELALNGQNLRVVEHESNSFVIMVG